MQRIVISINTTWNIYNFRSGLIKALLESGYEVIAVAPHDAYVPLLEDLGCKHISLPMDSNGTHPARDTLLLVRYFLLLRSLRPSAFLGYTVKPNVFGSMAAHALGIPVINNIAGLGAAFIADNHLTKIVCGLYKFALRRSHRVFFQNADDRDLFIDTKLVRSEISDLLPGSGVDLSKYIPEPPPALSGRNFRFLLVGRMLKDKGVEEFVAAARIVRQLFPTAEFQLLGSIDAANSNAIHAQKIAEWEAECLVSYFGMTDDVRPYLSNADCVVLPSYREGVPRSLLEAAAMARPIIATDVVGCRDAVEDGVNGFRCEVKNPRDLAEKMIRMIRLSPQRRLAIGAAGRRKVEAEFDEQIVIERYLQALDSLATLEPGYSGLTAVKLKTATERDEARKVA
jgi:glycosyltransferase involved in cell wall biosynthesis